MEQMKWYVLQVKSGSEERVYNTLLERNIQAALPRENRVIRSGGKWITKSYLVYPGYVFIRIRYSWSKYYLMSGINGVLKILGGGKNPAPLSDDEISLIKQISDLCKEPSVLEFDEEGNYIPVSGVLLAFKDRITEVRRRERRAKIKTAIAGKEHLVTVSFVYAEKQ